MTTASQSLLQRGVWWQAPLQVDNTKERAKSILRSVEQGSMLVSGAVH
jgi:hypothetical protein